MAERFIPADTWTVVPGAGIEVIRDIGGVARVTHGIDGSVRLDDSGWRVRAVHRAGGPSPEVLAFLLAELAYWRAQAGHLRGLVRAVIGALENGESDPVMGSRDMPEPPVGTEYWYKGARSWERRPDGWFCSRENCVNCPADWAEMRDFYDVTGQDVTRVLPGESFSG